MTTESKRTKEVADIVKEVTTYSKEQSIIINDLQNRLNAVKRETADNIERIIDKRIKNKSITKKLIYNILKI